MSRKKTVLLGLSIALIFLVLITNGVSAYGRCVLEATVEDLGCNDKITRYTSYGIEFWGTHGGTCSQRYAKEFFVFRCMNYSATWDTVKDKSPWKYEKKDPFPENNRTWTEFHGHKAVLSVPFLDRADPWHRRACLSWLVKPYQFTASGYFEKGYGNGYDKPKQTILEVAEVMYKNIIKCGIIEDLELPDCLTATTLRNVNVIYPDGTEMMCKDPTTIELAEGMTFKSIDSNSKATIRLPDRIIHDLEEVKINTLQITNESFDIAYDVKMKPDGMSCSVYDEIPGAGTIGPALEDWHYLYPGEKPEQGTIGPIPKDMTFLMDTFGVGLTGSRGELYATVIVKEVVEYAVIFVASTSMPFAAPAFIYDNLDKTGEITRGLMHLCQYRDTAQTTYYHPGPIRTERAVLTRSGQVRYNSQGLIGITNNKTEVYVFEGEFQLSDLNKTKTVTVYANQTSSCELNSVPIDPKPFDRRSINKIWETINKSADITKDKHTAESWTDDGSGCWETSNGLHTMTGNSKETKIRCLYGNQELCNFTFQADMRKTSGDNPDTSTYGLYFRGDGTTKNYYSFTITADGRYLIAKKVKGLYTKIRGATHSDSLKSGHNEWNTLSVNVEGLRTTFYINGDHTAEIVDGSFVRGKVALFAIDSSSSNTPDTVEFKNVQIAEIYETTPSITPDIEILPPTLRDEIYVIPIP